MNWLEGGKSCSALSVPSPSVFLACCSPQTVAIRHPLVRRRVPARAGILCIGTTPHINIELVVATEELPEKFSLLLGASSS